MRHVCFLWLSIYERGEKAVRLGALHHSTCLLFVRGVLFISRDKRNAIPLAFILTEVTDRVDRLPSMCLWLSVSISGTRVTFLTGRTVRQSYY